MKEKRGRVEREYPKTPLVAVGVLITSPQRDRVVLIERKHPPSKGYLSIPGGLIEVGETVKDAAAREAKEETGLNVKIIELIDVIDSIWFEGSSRKPKYHYVLIDFLAEPVSGEISAGGDVAKAMWVKKEKLENLKEKMTETVRYLLCKTGFYDDPKYREGFKGVFRLD